MVCYKKCAPASDQANDSNGAFPYPNTLQTLTSDFITQPAL